MSSDNSFANPPSLSENGGYEERKNNVLYRCFINSHGHALYNYNYRANSIDSQTLTFMGLIPVGFYFTRASVLNFNSITLIVFINGCNLIRKYKKLKLLKSDLI